MTDRAFTQDDAFRSMHVGDAVMTDDGIVFYQLFDTVGEPADRTERKRSTIRRLDPATGATAEITAWAADAQAPVLAADGRSLLFLATKELGGSAQLHLFDSTTGGMVVLTCVESGVAAFAPAPDGSAVAFAAAEPADPDRPADHVRITATNYRLSDVPGYLHHHRHALHVLALGGAATQEARRITGYDGLVTAITWAPDSGRIAYTVGGAHRSRRSAIFVDLHVTTVDGDRKTLLEEHLIQAPFWTADGQSIGFAGRADGGLQFEVQLLLVDTETGAVTSRTEAADRSVMMKHQTHNPGNVPGRVLVQDDEWALAPIGDGGRSRICRVALSGAERVEPVVDGPFVARLLARSGDQVLHSRQDELHPPELWVLDLTTGSARALTDHNAAWQAGIAWPTVERVEIGVGADLVEAWILLPADAPAPHPTVLSIHGGPHGAYGHSYNEDHLELVGAGYAVVYANPHGSTGYGDAFASSIVGRWGDHELDDLAAVLDEFVTRELIDPERLAVNGVSGGGHLTAWLMSHTDRFRAAVPEQGVYSMLSHYGVADIGPDLIALEMGGAPHEIPLEYWERSPIAHAHRCTTPVLLIQGEDDIRCPMEQAEQLYTILRQNGCEAEFLRLAGCNHGSQVNVVPSLRRLRMDAMKEWFDRHVLTVG